MDLVYLTASATVSAGVATTANVTVPGDGTEPATAVALVTVDGTVAEALLPRDGRHQLVALRVQVDGVTLSAHHLVGPITVLQRVDGFATFAFSVAIGEAPSRWPLGNPWTLRAPPPGLANVTVHGLYGTATGVHAFPLLTNGLVGEAELAELEGVPVLSLTGLGPGARHQRRRVSLAFLPGHGTRRGAVITAMARAAGVDSISIDGGRVMQKELLIESAPWLGTARQLAELDGHHLAWDEDGTLRTYLRVPPADAAADVAVTARDLLRGSFRASWPGDVPTRITLTTSEPLWDGEPCGRVTTVTTREVLEVSLPPRAKWRIVGNGAGPWSLDPVPAPSGEEPTPRVGQRLVTTTETVCDTVVASKVATYALMNPETWRYAIRETAPPGGPTEIVEQHRFVYLLDDAPQEDALGTEPAYAWETSRLVLVSEEFTAHTFDGEGYLAQTTVSRKGWSLQRWATKERPAAGFTDWETVPLIFPATYTRGSGDSIGNAPAEERYSEGYVGSDIELPSITFGQFTGRTTTDYSREGGFVVSETVTTEGPHLPAGDRYLYADGTTSNADREVFDVTGREVTVYAATGESTARKTVSSFDAAGQLLDSTSEDLGSYLPAATRLIDGSDPANPPRGNTRPVEESCTAPALEATHPRHDVSRSVPLAEDAADLESQCLQALVEGSLVSAEFQLPACFGLRKGMTVRTVLPHLDVRHVLLVQEVTHTAAVGGPVLTAVRGVIRAL